MVAGVFVFADHMSPRPARFNSRFNLLDQSSFLSWPIWSVNAIPESLFWCSGSQNFSQYLMVLHFVFVRIGYPFACVQTSPISFVARGNFPRATKEIGDVWSQARYPFAGIICKPRWRETKWTKVPCLRKQRDLNPGPPDLANYFTMIILSSSAGKPCPQRPPHPPLPPGRHTHTLSTLFHSSTLRSVKEWFLWM